MYILMGIKEFILEQSKTSIKEAIDKLLGNFFSFHLTG